MSKKQRILDMYGRLLGTMPETKMPTYIAALVGTSDSYVRTVARQRKGRGHSEAELRYLASPLGRAKDRRSSKAHYEKIKADPARWAAYLERSRLRYRRATMGAAEARP